MGFDRALIALSQREGTPSGGTVRSVRSPQSLRADSPARLIRDLERIWDVPDADLKQQMIAQLGHESPLVRTAACRTLGRVGDEAAISGLAECLGDETKVVRRAAAEALRLMGNRFNGSRRPGETQAQVRLVAELARALRSSMIAPAAVPRGFSPPTSATCRKKPHLLDPLLELCGDPRSGRRHASDQGVVAMVVLAGRLWREKSDRRHD